MTSSNKPTTSWQDTSTLNIVRPQVREILESSEGFKNLDPKEKQKIASHMVKIASYMANPDGLAKEELAPSGGLLKPPTISQQSIEPIAISQADATEEARKRASEDRGFAGEDFEAGAIRQGVEQFGQLVQTVDFPRFVGGLIENVFQAIVDSSIQQMRAYGELLANVAKTVDQFAQDNITENNARDWLAQRFPDQLGIETEGFGSGFAEGDEETPEPTPTLKVTAEDEEEALKNISDTLELAKPVTDLSDPEEERRLVLAARLQIARGRQQMLSSMVILGINRIVVTDGQINAKVIFGLKARDVAARGAKASMADRQRESSSYSAQASYGGWFSPVSASASFQHSSDHVATVQSSVEDTSESRAEVKAKLSGEVRVNFKSDFFPMERLASTEMIAAIQGNATPKANTVPE